MSGVVVHSSWSEPHDPGCLASFCCSWYYCITQRRQIPDVDQDSSQLRSAAGQRSGGAAGERRESCWAAVAQRGRSRREQAGARRSGGARRSARCPLASGPESRARARAGRARWLAGEHVRERARPDMQQAPDSGGGLLRCCGPRGWRSGSPTRCSGLSLACTPAAGEMPDPAHSRGAQSCFPIMKRRSESGF